MTAYAGIALVRAFAREKTEQGRSKGVIRIAGDHMVGIGHIDELGMGNELEKLFGRFATDQAAARAADQQGRNPHLARRFLEAADHLLQIGNTPADQHRIPMPVEATVLPLAQIALKSTRVFRARTMG